MLGMLIVLGLSFNYSDKGFGGALRLGIDAVLEAVLQGQRVGCRSVGYMESRVHGGYKQ